MLLVAAFVSALAGPLAPVPAATANEDDFVRAVETVRTRCFECHSGENVKGGLSLETAEGWAHALDLESPIDSELIYRLELPLDDGDAMPPSGDRVAATEIAALVRWIEGGADARALRGAQATAKRRAESEQIGFLFLQSGTRASIEYARAPGGTLHREYVTVSWSHAAAEPTGQNLASLGPYADRVVEIDLAGTTVTDDMLKRLPSALPALRVVHLERTMIGDAGLASLVARAPSLESLNLHSTQVTAASEATLAKLPGLQRLVAFGTPLDRAPHTDPFASLAGRHGLRLIAADRSGLRLTVLEETSVGVYRPIRGVWPAGAAFRPAAPLNERTVERLAAAGTLLVATEDGASVKEVRRLPDSRLEWKDGARVVQCVAEDGFVHWEGEPRSRVASFPRSL